MKTSQAHHFCRRRVTRLQKQQIKCRQYFRENTYIRLAWLRENHCPVKIAIKLRNVYPKFVLISFKKGN